MQHEFLYRFQLTGLTKVDHLRSLIYVKLMWISQKEKQSKSLRIKQGGESDFKKTPYYGHIDNGL